MTGSIMHDDGTLDVIAAAKIVALAWICDLRDTSRMDVNETLGRSLSEREFLDVKETLMICAGLMEHSLGILDVLSDMADEVAAPMILEEDDEDGDGDDEATGAETVVMGINS